MIQGSTAPVRCIPKRADQQRNVVMCFSILNCKSDITVRIKAVISLANKVLGGIESDSVSANVPSASITHQRSHPPVTITCSLADLDLTTVPITGCSEQRQREPVRRLSPRSI